MQRKAIAQIPVLIGLILMAVAIPVATKLTQTSQENRGKAASECNIDSDCGYNLICRQGLCVTPACTPNGDCKLSGKTCCSGNTMADNTCTGTLKRCIALKVTPTLAPMPTLSACTQNGACLKVGEVCCSGYAITDSVCTGTLKKCMPRPTTAPTITPSTCTPNNACKLSNKACCSGYTVIDNACMGTLRRCVAVITPTRAPTPTPCIRKEGVNSFSVDTPCTGGFRYMTFSCYDGFGRREGSSSSCKTSEVWQSYAKSYCVGHFSACIVTPTLSPIACTPYGECKKVGETCCNGYLLTDNTCVETLKRCMVKPTAVPTPGTCILNGACLKVGGVCCSGYAIADSVCSGTENATNSGTFKRCMVKPTAIPTKLITTPTPKCFANIDYNKDGSINSLDWIYCLQH